VGGEVSANVTLREQFQGGCTVNELVAFGARAVAFGLGGYDVRVVPVIPEGATLLANPNDLRRIEALEVTGPAPEMR
jgi:hypothetical protein